MRVAHHRFLSKQRDVGWVEIDQSVWWMLRWDGHTTTLKLEDLGIKSLGASFRQVSSCAGYWVRLPRCSRSILPCDLGQDGK
ncbi:hypothetical protein AVEN_258998-1 [Araneus ventricosus]|uniref:Uncharacterized protein n=1 Tax=Araneus ventricosus TaxID=182803 RepID=A0A4Y2FGR1_ARAVE|nr:hypothetical protein AVEN_258998-1 [Araneus ventricosus]